MSMCTCLCSYVPPKSETTNLLTKDMQEKNGSVLVFQPTISKSKQKAMYNHGYEETDNE